MQKKNHNFEKLSDHDMNKVRDGILITDSPNCIDTWYLFLKNYTSTLDIDRNIDEHIDY